MVVERYRVVPAVDVEHLRAALARLVTGPERNTAVVALGPSLLATLSPEAVPVGTYPFVDADRRVRPLRDDVVVLFPADPAATAVDVLDGTAELVDRSEVVADGAAFRRAEDAVLVVVAGSGPEGVRGPGPVVVDVVDGPAGADRAVRDAVAVLGPGADRVGADLYVLLPAGRLAGVLSPR